MMPSPTAVTTRIRKLHWKVALKDGAVNLHLVPGIDWYETGHILECLREMETGGLVVIDCSEVLISNAAAMGWLVSVHRWCTDHDISMKIKGLDEQEQKRLASVGLDRLLSISGRHQAVRRA